MAVDGATRQKKYAQKLAGKYASYKGGAKQRGVLFDLSLTEFSSFWQRPCHYCGYEIKTIGLDRVDNSRGYTLDNVVPACSLCNMGKGTLTRLQWLALCANVARMHGLIYARI